MEENNMNEYRISFDYGLGLTFVRVHAMTAFIARAEIIRSIWNMRIHHSDFRGCPYIGKAVKT
jgi:hypothetical protein